MTAATGEVEQREALPRGPEGLSTLLRELRREADALGAADPLALPMLRLADALDMRIGRTRLGVV